MNLKQAKSRLFFTFCGAALLTSANAQVGQIIWEENFNTVNTSSWNYVTGNGCQLGANMCGWGNFELENYTQNNVTVEDIVGEPGNKALVLQAKSETLGGSAFTSGKISTENKIAVKYGLIEVRMRAPKVATGLWPAAWLLGTANAADGWPKGGEIDMMEMGHSTAERVRQNDATPAPPTPAANNFVGANLIWYEKGAIAANNTLGAASIASDHWYDVPYVAATSLDDRFVIYRIYWDDKYMRFTCEDQGVERDMYTGQFPVTAGTAAFQRPFYFLLNLAVGGSFTDATTNAQVTATLPAKMYVDYIRVKKWNGKGEVFTPEKVMANAGADKSVTSGANLTLDASASYGPISTYTWSEGGVQIATGVKPVVTLSNGNHNLLLTVADANGNESSDDIIYSVATGSAGELIFEENFDSFDATRWNYVTGNGCNLPAGCGWGNQELENYQQANVNIADIPGEPGNKALVLEAKSESLGGSLFTSGKITSENKLAIKYGMVEFRMMAPGVATGLWPAVWLLGANLPTEGWPKCGEMDLMEMGHSTAARTIEGAAGVSPNNYVGSNLIWYSPNAVSAENQGGAASIAFDKWYNQPYQSATPLSNRFITYRMYWDDGQIRFTVFDGATEHDLYTGPFPLDASSAAFKKPFYFILNLAVGGSFTDAKAANQVTATLPAKMYVDYIRVKKWNGKGEVFGGSKGFASAGPDKAVVDLDKNGKETVALDASTSYGNITSYEWSENGVSLGTGKTVSVNLANGFHNITLTVKDASGSASTDEQSIDVREILWEDNFNTLNTSNWNIITGNGCELGANLCGWGNQELEYYQAPNVTIEPVTGETNNNALVLTAKKETVNGSPFTSGKVTSANKVSVKYGLVEVRMKAPKVETGIWPAAWLLGIENVAWPKNGEIDMMEMGHQAAERLKQGADASVSANRYVGSNAIWYDSKAVAGNNPTGAASIAYDTYYNQPYIAPANNALSDRFVIYRLYWTEKELRFVIEDQGVEYNLYTGPFPLSGAQPAFKKPFYLLLNLAVGGSFTDATSAAQVTATTPAKMAVDYVRVMKYNGYGDVAFANGLSAKAGSDIVVLDADKNGSEAITLDGSGSSSMTGNTITKYSWTDNGTEIATSVIPTVNLSTAPHVITLTITDDKGNTATDEVIVMVSNGTFTTLGKTLAESTLDVYPSLVTDILNVTSTFGEVEKIEVYNISGIKVIDQYATTQVNMSCENPGIYIVVATINGQLAIKKVVKK